MSTKSLGTLTLDIVAKTGGFVQGMSKAERQSKKWRKQVERDMKQASAALRNVATVAVTAGAVVGGAFTAMAIETINGVSELENFATLADTTTQQFQRMAYGADRFNIQQDKLADILKDVNDRVGDFISTGGGPMADFFENIAPKVGVTAEQFARLSGPDALQLYVKSLEQAGVSQQEMTFYMEALASDATALLPLLKNNGAELNRLGNEAERTGNVFNEIEFTQLKQAKAGIDELTGSFTGLKNEMVVAALPAINELIDTLNSPQVKQVARDLAISVAEGMTWMAEESGHVVDAFKVVIDVVDGVSRVIKLAGRAGALMAIEFRRDLARLAEFIYSGPIDAINTLIEQINRIPGIELDGDFEQPAFVKDLQQQVALFEQASKEARADMQAILMQPMASERLQQSFDASSSEPPTHAGGAIDADALNAANAVAEMYQRTAAAGADAEAAQKDNATATKGASQAVEHFSRSAVDGARAIQRAASFDWSGDPGAYGADQPSSVQERINSRRDPGVINYQANPNAHSTWGGDLGGSRMNAAASRADSGNGGGRNLGTLTLKNDNGEIDVEANNDELSKWLANTLSGTAAAT